jgi:hypothetical protein
MLPERGKRKEKRVKKWGMRIFLNNSPKDSPKDIYIKQRFFAKIKSPCSQGTTEL